MAIACFGFVTFLPLRPLRSFPCFIACISRLTSSPALGLYLRPELFFFELDLDADFRLVPFFDDDLRLELLLDDDFFDADFRLEDFLLEDLFAAFFVAMVLPPHAWKPAKATQLHFYLCDLCFRDECIEFFCNEFVQ